MTFSLFHFFILAWFQYACDGSVSITHGGIKMGQGINPKILRVDIIEDAGESISPEIDIGEIKGGFVMGLGYSLTENKIYDQKTGLTLNSNTSNYWVPGPKDIPIDFRVTLLKNAPNPYEVIGLKATGEPPVCLALSGLCIKECFVVCKN